jgi:hypothetical protein
MKDEIKLRLAKTILQFKNTYLIKENEIKKKKENNESASSYAMQNNTYSQNNLNYDDI